MLKTRIISAAVALPLLFIVVIINAYIFLGALFILSFIGLYEYFNAAEHTSVKSVKYIGISFGLILFILMVTGSSSQVLILLTLCILVFLSVPVFKTDYNFIGAGMTITGILYVPFFFGYLGLLRKIPDIGNYLIWFVFICAFSSDTFAYFTGRALGRKKLCPDVSPNKTIEGSIGGIIGSAAGCVIYGSILNHYGILDIDILHYIVMGIAASIVSQLGDLAASSIKRNVGIKDYGNIMPGHGGVLDRFDSILFAAPLIYYYIVYIFKVV